MRYIEQKSRTQPKGESVESYFSDYGMEVNMSEPEKTEKTELKRYQAQFPDGLWKSVYKVNEADKVIAPLREIEKYIICRYSDMFPNWAYVGPLDAIDKMTIEHDKLQQQLKEKDEEIKRHRHWRDSYYSLLDDTKQLRKALEYIRGICKNEINLQTAINTIIDACDEALQGTGEEGECYLCKRNIQHTHSEKVGE